MPETRITYDELLKIVKLINSSTDCREFNLKYGDLQIEINKNQEGLNESISIPVSSTSVVATNNESIVQENNDSVKSQVASTIEDIKNESSHEPSEKIKFPEGAEVIKSPMVGTFYRSPEPGAAPFVEVGQEVNVEDTVCLIEVMKLFNTIKAGCNGVVTDILIGDGEPVEYGQPIIVIQPK